MKFLRLGLALTNRRSLSSSYLTMSSSSRSFSALITPEDAISLHSSSSSGSSSSGVKFVDGSWYLGGIRDPNEEYLKEHIPSSVRFDMDATCDKDSTLPHMLPTTETFSKWATNSGIHNNDKVIIYGGFDCFSAPRIWWTFKSFGHEDVCILDGGIEGWKAAGGAIESGTTTITPSITSYQANKDDSIVVTAKRVLDIVNSGECQIIDARPSNRFTGADPEPRPGLERGHIPGSLNLPFATLLSDKDKSKFKSLQEIKNTLSDSGVILGATSITTCGSGVTACVLSFCLHLMGADIKQAPVYDGSFAEWGLPTMDVPRITSQPPNEQ